MVARSTDPPSQTLPAPVRAELRAGVVDALEGDDPAGALCRVAAVLVHQLAADRCSMLAPLSPDRLKIFASSDVELVGELEVALDRYPELEHVLESGEPVLIRDVAASDLLRPVRELVTSSGTGSIVAVPLRLDGTRGILRITSRTRSFTPSDADRLAAAALFIERTIFERTPGRPRAGAWERLLADRREERLQATIAQQSELIERLRAEVEELTARRTLFLSASAHELKTPLTVLQVYLETLATELSDGMSEEQRSFVEICHDSVLRLRRLVLDLVDLAALDTGRVSLEMEKVEVNDLLSEVVNEMQPLAGRAELSLFAHPCDPTNLLADPVRIRQILHNLVDNAIKNTPAGGSVDLRATPLRDLVEISVSDTGVGIPADRLEAVFQEFVQLTRTHEGGGSGLGLTICRRLAEAMGGRITVSSEEGVGSVFSVTLPSVD